MSGFGTRFLHHLDRELRSAGWRSEALGQSWTHEGSACLAVLCRDRARQVWLYVRGTRRLVGSRRTDPQQAAAEVAAQLALAAEQNLYQPAPPAP